MDLRMGVVPKLSASPFPMDEPLDLRVHTRRDTESTTAWNQVTVICQTQTAPALSPINLKLLPQRRSPLAMMETEDTDRPLVIVEDLETPVTTMRVPTVHQALESTSEEDSRFSTSTSPTTGTSPSGASGCNESDDPVITISSSTIAIGGRNSHPVSVITSNRRSPPVAGIVTTIPRSISKPYHPIPDRLLKSSRLMCFLCDQKAKNGKTLATHIVKSHSISTAQGRLICCTDCGFRCTLVDQLKDHYNETHCSSSSTIADPRNSSNNSQQSHPNSLNNIGLTSIAPNPNSIPNSTTPSTDQSKKAYYPCSHCSRMYRKQSLLDAHMRLVNQKDNWKKIIST